MHIVIYNYSKKIFEEFYKLKKNCNDVIQIYIIKL